MTQAIAVEASIAPKGPRQPSRQLWPIWLAGAVVLLCSFVLVLLLNFPLESLRKRIEQEIGRGGSVNISIGELGFSLPPGVAAKQIVLTPNQPGAPVLKIERLEISPRWSSLTGENPAANFEASLYGGRVTGQIARNGSLQARAKGLNLSHSFAELSGAQLSALAEATIMTQGPLFSSSGTLEGSLSLRDLNAQGLEALPLGTDSLSLGTLNAKFAGRSRSLKLTETTLSGDSLEMTTDGSIFIGDSPEKTRLALQIKLRPSSNLPSAVQDLFIFLPKAGRDGFHNLRISGTLANPSVK